MNASSDEIFISFSDLKRIFFKNKRKIKKAALFCGTLAFLFFALKAPPAHKATATFRNAAGKNDQLMGFKSILKNVGIQEQDSIAMALMQSKKLMRHVVEDLGMQASVKTSSFLSKGFLRVYENLLSECRCSLPDADPFVFKDVRYLGEKGSNYLLHFTGPETFEVLDKKKNLIAKGLLNEKVEINDLQFILSKTPSCLSLKKYYSLRFEPWHRIVENALKKFEVRPSRIDRNVLVLSFSHRDRHLAANVINQMMLAYQQYLKDENEEITAVQMAYLEKRQQELTQKFDRILEEQVVYMRRNLEENGYIGLSQEIELLAAPKEEYTAKLLEMDLELKRLEKLKKKKKDLISFDENEEDGKKSSEKIEKVKNSSTGSKRSKKDEKEEKASAENILLNPLDVEKEDYQKRLLLLDRQENKILSQSSSQKERKEMDSELEAMSLESAQELYKEYNREHDSIQATINQLLYFRDQMKNPDFELSSLSNLLNDSVSFEMIQKASHLSLQLRDENNRSIKEQERLKEQLETQKQFISHHIGQTIELQKLRTKLIGEKIGGLQELSLKLIKNEKKLIEEKLQELHHRMSDLPEKWRMENQLKMKKELSMSMIEGMTQLAESKIVNHHLFQVESKPLDLAYPAEDPVVPKLLIASFTAAFLGGLSLYALSLFQELIKGLPLSVSQINAYQQHFCGTLSSNCDCSLQELKGSDLETLRKMAEFLTTQKKNEGGHTACLIGGKDFNYSHGLATLLGMQGLKVLLVESHFKGIVPSSHVPGLLQYLESEEKEPSIRKKEHYHFLPSGGTTSHGAEILKQSKFSAFVATARQNYDFVLLHTPASLQNMEAQLFLKFADTIVGAVAEERWEDIQPYRQWSLQKEKEAFSCVLLGSN